MVVVVTFPAQQELERWAASIVARFVQNSSCIERRDGLLSLRYHRRALPPGLLKALTAIHSYVLRHNERTTAAERLFGVPRRPHTDLFEHLHALIPLLPLPRKRTG